MQQTLPQYFWTKKQKLSEAAGLWKVKKAKNKKATSLLF